MKKIKRFSLIKFLDNPFNYDKWFHPEKLNINKIINNYVEKQKEH